MKSRHDIEAHPLADRFPLIEGADFDELVADIAKNGVREPVVIHEGMILDGRNRWRAAQAAGVECPTRIYEGTDPLAFVISANIHRRHLTADDKRTVIADLLKADPTKSNRQIAKTVRASHPHIGKVRAELEKSGDVETVATSVDTKGRKQPARRPRQLRIPGTTSLSPPAPPKPVAPPAPRDDIGPDSAGERARLSARNLELENETRRLRLELKAAEQEHDSTDDLFARIATAAPALAPAAKQTFIERLKSIIASLEDDLPPRRPNGGDQEADGADDDLAIPAYLRRGAA